MPRLEEIIQSIPPVSRYWTFGIIAIGCAVQVHIVNPYQLYFSFDAAFMNAFQPWRIVTTFLYHGTPGFEMAIHFMWFFRYGRWLEETYFSNKSAEYLMLLLVSAVMILLIAPPFTLPFLQPSLAFVPIYIWSRKNTHEQVAILGLIQLPAPYLPIAMIGISWLMNGSIKSVAADIVGCIVGHVVWFLLDAWPLEVPSGEGKTILKPPDALKRLMGEL